MRGHAGLLRSPADVADYDFTARAGRPAETGRSRDAAFPERARHAASGEQHRRRALVSGRGRAAARRAQGPRPGRRRDAAVELRRARAHRAVAAAGALRRLGAAPQPALPRCAHAARADARRLHRQLEHRADGAGVPPGGARRAARGGVAVAQGFERIGILGTSLGSCLAMLTSAHEPRIRAQALNHVSPWFADVVWRGLSTRHVRAGARRPHRPRSAAGAVAADQPVRVPRSRARQADAARLRAIRPDVSGRPVGDAGRGVPGQTAAARGLRAAMRALQHRRGAVQVRRWVCVDEIPSSRKSSEVGRVFGSWSILVQADLPERRDCASRVLQQPRTARCRSPRRGGARAARSRPRPAHWRR